MSTYTYKYNNNQEEREIFFQELCECQDTNLANTTKIRTFNVNKRYILQDAKGDIKMNSTIKKFSNREPKYLSTTELLLTDFENGSIQFVNPEVFYNKTKKCFRGVYEKTFSLLGIGVSGKFLAKQFIIDVEMFDNGLRIYTVVEK